ncbi:hypothetical protein NQZ68_016638 [Dissostichus eleginoides]|nr:hypothetical protein NQZ68_016638 [Dissostichus eleginoides]
MEGRRQAMVPPESVLGWQEKCENVYSQRLPLGQGWWALTGNKPRPMSQSFSWGWQPSLSGTPNTPPHHSTSRLLNTLPHLSLSGMPAQVCQGHAGPVKIREDVCPAYRAF